MNPRERIEASLSEGSSPSINDVLVLLEEHKRFQTTLEDIRTYLGTSVERYHSEYETIRAKYGWNSVSTKSAGSRLHNYVNNTLTVATYVWRALNPPKKT